MKLTGPVLTCERTSPRKETRRPNKSAIGTGVFLKWSRDIGHEGSVHMDRGKLDDTNIVTAVTYNVTMFVDFRDFSLDCLLLSSQP